MDDSARFDELCHSYLTHSGVKNMHWCQHDPNRRWQSQAVYAQGRPNPDAKVRGSKLDDAKERMQTKNHPDDSVESDAGRKLYSQQQLKDLSRLSGPPTFKTRMEINHPSNEKSGAGRHYNCPNCSAAFDMQERGYYTIARISENGSNVGEIERMYKGGNLVNVATRASSKVMRSLGDMYSKQNYDKFDKQLTRYQTQTADNTIKAIERQGKGARGMIVVGWIDDPTFSDRTTCYHAFNYKNENDGVKFYDTQTRKPAYLKGMNVSDAKKDFFLDVDPREVYLMRTDNLEPTEAIMSAVYSPDRSLNHSYLTSKEILGKFKMMMGANL